MINHLHKIAIVTDDVEGAVRFYTQTLDLEVLERFPNEGDEDFVFLKAGDVILELMPAKTMNAPVGFHHISFKVDSVDKRLDELRQKGVEIAKEPGDAGDTGIRLGFFVGPNKMNLQLFQRRPR